MNVDDVVYKFISETWKERRRTGGGERDEESERE